MAQRAAGARRQEGPTAAAPTPHLTGGPLDASAWGLLPIPARDVESLAGDPAGIVRRQEDGRRPYVSRLTDPAQRRLRLELLPESAFFGTNPGGRCAFGLDDAGVDRVDADLAWPQLLGQRPRQGINGGLGRAVDRSRRRSRRGDH